jgi:hypothetical protein
MLVLLILAGGAFLLASRRISPGRSCLSSADCTGCGMKRICSRTEKNEMIQNGEE